MVSYILLVTTACFVIGAAAVARLNSRSDAVARRERWVKYVLYLIIVYSVIASIIAGSWYFSAIAVMIAGTGYYEILYNGLKLGEPQQTSIAFLIYTIALAGFAGFVLSTPPVTILAVYFLVLIFDGFSQVCGQLFGRRRLAPYTSPNKTTEGFVLGAIIAMGVCAYPFFNGGWSMGSLVFFMLSCPVALAGDLGASYYKRRLGIKDYSDLIPGHGGVLDRFDSFIAVGAFCFLINFIAD